MTATDDVEDIESLTLSGTVGDTPAGSVKLTIDDDAVLPIALTLATAPAPAEGRGEGTVKATLDGPAPNTGQR